MAKVPIDLQRILEAAAKAAVEEQAASRKPKKHRLSTGRAILLGAGLATAGRLLVGHKGRDVLGRVQDRIADLKSTEDGEPEEAEDYEDELEDLEDEPGRAGDDEFEAEDENVADDAPDPEGGSDEDEDTSELPEPERPPARPRRQRGRA
jgi:hypothetical protein